MKNIDWALGYADKALGLDMWGDKIWFGFGAKDCVATNLWHFYATGKFSYLDDGLFGFRYDNVGYIVSTYGADWFRKGHKRKSYNFNNMMAIEQIKPIYK
jgi:hypothetical protein